MASKIISTILNLKDNFSNVIKKTTSNTKGFTNGVKESGEQVSKIGSGIKNTFKDIGEAIKNGIGIGAGMDIWNNVKDGISETINFSNDLQKSLNKIQIATGMTNEAMYSMKETMLDVYNDNFGENFGDIGEAIKTISQQTGASGNDLKDLTKNALALKDAFGYEVRESIRSANTLIKQFGLDGNEAFNLIAQGKQSGLDYSNEMLDSITEYSVQFKKLGFSAEDMFEVFNNGATDGAFNLDKVGDAVKEFSIRAIDGSNTTIDGFTQLGLNVDEMANKFASGGDVAKEAFKQVTKAIGDMNDPVQQSIVGVDLFGTMWEDLGPKVVTQLGDIGYNFSATSDALNQIKKINFNDVGSAFQYIKRNIQTGILVPIGDKVLPKLNEFANWFKSNIPKIKEKIGSVTNTFLNVGSSIAEKVFPNISNLASSIGNLVSTIYSSLVPAFRSVKPDSWKSVSDAIGWIIDKAKEVVDFINDNWSAIQPMIEGITGAIIAWKVAIIAVNTWSTIVTVTTSAWSTIELIIWGIKNATTAWEAAQFALNVVMTANPVGLVMVAIVALGAVIYEVIIHWKDICKWTQNAWDKLKNNPVAAFIVSMNPFTKVLFNIAKHFDDITSSISKAWGWLKSWNNTDAKEKNITVNENTTTKNSPPITSDFNIPKFATGTQYFTGGQAIVGEHGAELVNLPNGSQVNTNSKTNKILSGGNNPNISITIQGNVIGNESFIDQIGSVIYNKVSLALVNS